MSLKKTGEGRKISERRVSILPVVSKSFKQKSLDYIRLNPPLIPMKLLCFVFYSGLASVFAYLTIHMKFLGLNEGQIGIIYACLPASFIFGPPIFGPLADRFQIHKYMLIVFCLLTAGIHNCLQIVPSYSIEDLPDPELFLEGVSPVVSYLHVLVPAYCPLETTKLTVTASNCTEAGASSVDLDSCFIRGSISKLARSTFDNETYTVFNLLQPESLNETDFCFDMLEKLHLAKIRCNAVLSRGHQCKEGHGSALVTFGWYFFVRFFCSVLASVTFILLEAIVLALMETHNGNYGANKLWQGVGMAVATPLAGLLMDYTSERLGYDTYFPAFALLAGALVFSAIVLLFMKVPADIKPQSIGKNVTRLFKYPNIMVFFLAVCFLGCQWGFLESFSFVFFEQIGASRMEMGLTVTVGSIASMPFVFMSKAIFKRTGYISIIIFAYYVYSMRYLGYSLVYEMRWVYFFELLEVFTQALMWIAAVSYSATITPPGMYATVQTILGALHFGLGKGTGSLIGGFLWNSLGARKTYQIMSGVCFLTGIVYTIAHVVWLRHYTVRRRQSVHKFSMQSDPGYTDTGEMAGFTAMGAVANASENMSTIPLVAEYDSEESETESETDADEEQEEVTNVNHVPATDPLKKRSDASISRTSFQNEEFPSPDSIYQSFNTLYETEPLTSV